MIYIRMLADLEHLEGQCSFVYNIHQTEYKTLKLLKQFHIAFIMYVSYT